ncbi:hypothetical protein LOTGIDRAFT_152822 [Lottia gigantea]|uniref:Uncharacterized protein n=1 Tax=Lottia gigantea TaxID=225164 RepID=V4C7P8_LOTGI|nr:hypothetical protein LOTGIDRAFT_152822 [Lottia gigantea]ESO97729.1 hypothetical protein LOTGIDRAFT_152822 [Lottia gigantea]
MSTKSKPNKQKAQYKPSKAGSAGRRKSTTNNGPPPPLTRRPTRGSGGIGTISEPDTVASDSSDILARGRYDAPLGPNARLTNQIQEYLDQTGLETNFKMVLNRLLNRTDLPYNPYPGFAVRMRKFAERFYLEGDTTEKIEMAIGKLLQETSLLNLYTLKENPCVWGLSSLLPTVNPGTLSHYKWLLEDITPTTDDIITEEDFTVLPVVAIVGPTVFLGSFYNQTHLLQLRITYIIAGPDVSQGVPLFVNNVMRDIDDLDNSKQHRLLGVNVPIRISGEGKTAEWSSSFWDPNSIQEDKAGFLQQISDAVIGNRYINVECVFRVDPTNQMSYVRGQKQYALNFIEITDTITENGLSCFSEFPMSSLHEGVFLNQTQAEHYFCIFTPQTEEADLQNIHIGSARGMTRQSSTRRLSTSSQGANVSGLQNHVYQQLERYKPQKIRIDGFKLGGDTGSGPFAWQIVSPLKSHYQRNIAKNSPTNDLFTTVYNVLLLVLMERSSYSPTLLIEIYRLLHGTPGRLNLLMEQNISIRALLRGFANTDDIYIIRYLLARYKSDIEELLSSSLQERSDNMVACGRTLLAKIDDLLAPDDFQFGSASHLMLIVNTLRNINSYCQTMAIQVAEDSLQWCPKLVDLIEKMQKTFPTEMQRPQTKLRDKSEPKKKTGTLKREVDEVYKHGVEDENIIKHENSVINVQMCIERDTSPKIMSTESVLMKYMIDTHLDETWYNFLVELFTGEYLPPNPYARFITRLRECAMRMDLCFEKPSDLLERIMDNSPKLVDSENFVYQLPNCDVFGPLSIMSVLDADSFLPIAQIVAKHFIPRNYIQRKGPFRVGICPAITGNTVYYGKLQPYIREITIDEHYYIQGPTGCEDDVRELFAKIVHSHVCELIERKTYPVMGVYMGDEEIRWPWEDILNKRKGFWTEFEMVASRKEPAYLKAYIVIDGWRYVPVKKNFLLHFLNTDGIGQENMFAENSSGYYHSVFLSKDRAAFHFQNGGPPRSGDPMSDANIRSVSLQLNDIITSAKQHGDWLKLHRALLLESTMSQRPDHIIESWRMLHSMASQAEYVYCLGMSLRDLTLFNTEYIKWLNLIESDVGTEVNSFANSTIGKKTLQVLEEICYMIKTIQDTISNDVHNISPQAQSGMSSIENDEAKRPISVASTQLDNPNRYHHPPKAIRAMLSEGDVYMSKPNYR